MITRLIFLDSQKNITIASKQLATKYKDLEKLSSEVQMKHCNSPELVDDYMVWQALNAYDKQLERSDVGQVGDSTPLTFKESLIFHTTDFYQVLTPKRMELLQYIHTHNPKSVKSLAEELSRDYKNVYDDVLALERFNLLQLIREGKNKRPVSRITAIEVLMDK